jgi:hypothetical protein
MLVRNIASQIGENAGKIWNTIAANGEATLDYIESETNLSKKDTLAAIGWLARENKIKNMDGKYVLDETNLETVIGSTAGKVYKILDIWEQADLNTMSRLSDQSDEDIYTALGWLAREDKIKVDEEKKYTLKYD